MHTRIRKFNTRDTYPEQKLDNDLCHAVVARGRTVFVRGQVGQELDTALNVGVGDVAAQAEQAMSNIRQLLGEAGAGARTHLQGDDLSDGPALSRGRVPDHRTLAQGRVPGVHGHHRCGTGAAGMAGGGRCDRGDTRYG